MNDTDDIKELISAQISTLPAPVRNAITSSEIERHLRALAEKHKLHFDQWDSLEREVMLTLLGIHPIEELEYNMMGEVGISLELSHALAADINTMIFEPIRQELERQLEHPQAREKEISGVEAARQQQLQSNIPPAAPVTTTDSTPSAQSSTTAVPAAALAPSTTSAPIAPTPAPPAPAVTPATPPPPTPDIKVTRPSESTAYRPGEASHERKSVADDPYREPVA